MPRIKCHYIDCVFLDDGYCSAAQVEIDPDTGCATFSPTDANAAGGPWTGDAESEEWEEDDSDEEDGDWAEEDEEEF